MEVVKLDKATKASYAVLIACIIAHFFNHVYTGVLSPFLPLIRQELSLTLTQTGMITSVLILTMNLSHMGVGYLGDKGWREIFIPATVISMAFGVLLISCSEGFWFLIVSQALLGVAASGYHPSAFPTLAERFPLSSRAKSTSIQAVGGLLGMALVPMLGVILLLVFGGWRQSLVLLGLIGIVSFFPVAVLIRYSTRCPVATEKTSRERTESTQWKRNFVLGIVYMGLKGMSFRSITLMMPLYLVDSHAYEPVLAGALTSLMLISGVAGELVAGPLSDRTGRRTDFMVISTVVSAFAIALLSFTVGRLSLIIILIVLGFFFFLGEPTATAYLTEMSPKEQSGIAFGLLFSVGAIPGAISPTIFGFIGDIWGLSMAIWFLTITISFASLIAFVLTDSR